MPRKRSSVAPISQEFGKEYTFGLLLLCSMVVFFLKIQPRQFESIYCAHYGSVSSCQVLERKFVENCKGLLSKVPPSRDFDKIWQNSYIFFSTFIEIYGHLSTRRICLSHQSQKFSKLNISRHFSAFLDISQRVTNARKMSKSLLGDLNPNLVPIQILERKSIFMLQIFTDTW